MVESANVESSGIPVLSPTLALTLVRAWLQNSRPAVPCPACAAENLTIVDRSARPYREWYALSCSSCGLAQTVSVSLAAPIPGAD